MKKVVLFSAMAFALIMASCGGEKKEEKKEEKKPVSEETKKAFGDLKTQWAMVDGMIQTLDGALLLHDPAQVGTYIDSLKGVAEKAKGNIKDQALPLIDSLYALNEKSKEWKAIVDGEKETWGMITEDFNKVNTDIEKGEADEEKTAPRVEGFTEQFKYKQEVLGPVVGQWSRMQMHDEALKAILAGPAK